MHLDGKSSLDPGRLMLKKLPEFGAETPGLSALCPGNRMKSYEMGAWCLMRKTHRREKEKQRRQRDKEGKK